VGIGSAVLPWLALHGSDAWSDDRLSIHQLRPSPASTWYLYWPAGRTKSPLATRAIDIAVEAADELANHM
jgi:DNA-binding transcriptional LysR family regulator